MKTRGAGSKGALFIGQVSPRLVAEREERQEGDPRWRAVRNRGGNGYGSRKVGAKPIETWRRVEATSSSVGETDELGGAAVTDRFHVKNLHATILRQLGFDPNEVTYFYNGLNQKLVGVEGAEAIRQIIG